MRRPAQPSSAVVGMGVGLWSAMGGVGELGILLGANRALAPVAQRQAAVSCATARRRERLLLKSRAAANDRGSKVKAREIRASAAASAGQPRAPVRPCRPSILQRRSAARLQALRAHDRAHLQQRGHDHNRLQPPAQRRREEVARPQEAVAGARNDSRPALLGINYLCAACGSMAMRLQHKNAAGIMIPAAQPHNKLRYHYHSARSRAVVFASSIKIGAVGSEIDPVGAASSLSRRF